MNEAWLGSQVFIAKYPMLRQEKTISDHNISMPLLFLIKFVFPFSEQFWLIVSMDVFVFKCVTSGQCDQIGRFIGLWANF